MISEDLLERMFRTQAAAVMFMRLHPNDYKQREYDAGVTRVFTMGEILQYTDEEIAAELNLEMSPEVAAKLAEDKQTLLHEVERFSGKDPYEELDAEVEEPKT